MSWILVPPAQAEALFDAHSDFDTQDDLRDEFLGNLCRFDRAPDQPWRDDDGDDLPAVSDALKSRLPRTMPSFAPAR